jgi:hypothetical protein
MLKSSVYAGSGSIDRYRHYSLGLCVRHRSSFMKEVERICSLYPWATRSSVSDLSMNLIACAQSDMLILTSKALNERNKIPGFISVSLFINDCSFVIVLECIIDLFDSYDFSPRITAEHYTGGYFTGMIRRSAWLDCYAGDTARYELSDRGIAETKLCISDKMHYSIVHEDDFTKEGSVLWKRISSRLDNKTHD